MASENSTMWEFIAPSEYTPPPATIAHAVKGGVKGLWLRLKSDSPATVIPVKAEEDLHGLAGDLLECAAAARVLWRSAIEPARTRSWQRKKRCRPPVSREPLSGRCPGTMCASQHCPKDYVSSLLAGIVTPCEMPYRLGDWITVEGVDGEVKSIGMRALEIVTPDDTVTAQVLGDADAHGDIQPQVRKIGVGCRK